MMVVLVIGLVMTAITLGLAGRRVMFLWSVISSGQPAPDRIEGVTQRTGNALKTQLVEVFGQKKMLKWSIPGAAHVFVMYAFFILASVYLEAYGALFNSKFHIPIIGHWAILGFLQDFIGMMCFFGIVTFAIIRLKNSPEKLGRKSRFKGSHLGGAWLTLGMIVNVLWTMFLFRGAASAAGNLPYKNGAFISIGLGKIIHNFSDGAITALEHVGLLLHIGVMLVFLIFVLNSKHLHIFLAPINILFGRSPIALGAVKPLMIHGKPLDIETMEDMDEADFERLGVGKIEDFSWKGLLDFSTCTECGRCQSQCPAWATEKPLSPKLLIMELRDHALAKAPHTLAAEADRAGLGDTIVKEAERPLIGDAESYGVIDPDVLWSCTNCGACVQQCPVDIEHVDHIIDMRRYQVLVESNFPSELNNIFKGLERKGNPWGMDPKNRMDWAKGLDFEVKQVGRDIEDLDSVEWLFWVGCAGAYEDRAKKTTQAVAELLNTAGVTFGVLGDGETCTGDPARRAGNEIVFAQLAQQNAEVFKETKVKKVVSTCAHCFNTLKNEYAEFGVELEVVHHTQLLNRLVREGKLTPVAPTGPEVEGKTITYHDPCFLGRHNQVYEPPRELLSVIPGATFKEMPRNSEKSFCCGAGGARMWMEETIGSRINVNRTEEAIATGADQIAVGCPFCRTMLDDGLTLKQSEGLARPEVEVLDVAQMLLASIKRAPAAAAPAPADEADVVAEAEAATAAAVVEETPVEEPAVEEAPVTEPAADDEAEASAPDVPASDKEAAAAANVGPVNTDLLPDAPAATTEPEPAVEAAPEAKPEPAVEAEADASTPDVPASDKEAAAAANVGPVNTDLLPDAPAATTEPEPAVEAEPAAVTDAEPAPEPVTEAKAEAPEEIVAVEDSPAPDPVDEDIAPLTNPAPSGNDVSAGANKAHEQLSFDNHTETEASNKPDTTA